MNQLERNRKIKMICLCYEISEKPKMDLSGVKDITVKAGQQFQIKIPFTAHPKPTATWTCGDREIEESSTTQHKVSFLCQPN